MTRVLAAALLFIGLPAQAGIVNVQPILGEEDEDGLSAEVSAGLNINSGNVNLFITRGALLLRLQSGDHRLISSSNGALGFSGGNEFMNQGLTHLRHQWALGEVVTWETYTQAGHNRYRRLARGLAGSGPRFELVRGDDVGLAVAASYLFELQRFTEGDFPDSGLVQRNHRASTYVNGSLKVDPTVTLVHTTYFQPRLDQPSDYRVLTQSGLAVKLSENLGLRVDFSLAWYTAPPHGVEPQDLASTVGLTYKL